jgi:hypothetical protein
VAAGFDLSAPLKVVPMLRNADDHATDTDRCGGWTREQLVEMNRGFVEAMQASLPARRKPTGAGFNAPMGAPSP